MRNVMCKNAEEEKQYKTNIYVFYNPRYQPRTYQWRSLEKGICQEFSSLCGDLTSEMEVGGWTESLRKGRCKCWRLEGPPTTEEAECLDILGKSIWF